MNRPDIESMEEYVKLVCKAYLGPDKDVRLRMSEMIEHLVAYIRELEAAREWLCSLCHHVFPYEQTKDINLLCPKCNGLLGPKETVQLAEKNRRIERLEAGVDEMVELLYRIETADDVHYEQDPPPKRFVLELSEWDEITAKARALAEREESK